MTNAASALTDLYSGEVSTDLGARSTHQDYDYWTYSWYDEEAGIDMTEVGCVATIDIPKDAASDAAFWDTWTVTTGVKIFDAIDSSSFVSIDDATTLTDPATTAEITDADYEFGDAYEFKEEPVEDDIFAESESFLMSDFIDGAADETGFMKTAGGFKIIPNFETALWYFRFQLEMPTEYFDSDNVMYAQITLEPTDESFPAMTTVCAVQMGDPASAVVYEYDDTFSAVATGSGDTIETQNAGAFVDDSDWSRDYDAEKYMLLETINGKSRQTCVARVELAPEEADFFFDRDYTVSVTGRVYDDWESDSFLEL